MPTICPKCRTVRPENAVVPDWQCPACGVAYAKAGGGTAALPSVQRAHAARASGGGGGLLSQVPWGKLFAVYMVVQGAWLGFNYSGARTSTAATANPTMAQITQLAASTPASEVVMYSATWCPYCTQAKGWLAQQGFKAEICEIDKDSSCLAQLQALDPKTAVPYLVVKGHHMKNGFDSDEFLAAVGKSSVAK
jgi:glutaredoxin